jgi:hypothetical protein
MFERGCDDAFFGLDGVRVAFWDFDDFDAEIFLDLFRVFF